MLAVAAAAGSGSDAMSTLASKAAMPCGTTGVWLHWVDCSKPNI